MFSALMEQLDRKLALVKQWKYWKGKSSRVRGQGVAGWRLQVIGEGGMHV